MPAEIKRLPVWGRWLRLSHWSMACALFVLMFSGWLHMRAPELVSWILDAHYYASTLLITAFVIRIYLLFFGRGSDLLESCSLDRHKFKQALAVLSSYLTLGKIPLPRWYAHNPLWGPLYLLLFLLIAVQIISGLLLTNHITLLGDFSIRSLHQFGFQFTLGFSLLHILAVFMHDLKGTGSDVSAMISGQRIFVVEPQTQQPAPSSVPLDDLTRQLRDNKSGKH
jgi:Ni/Fe-hydrogenase 1 B-type cytochrome subunit